MNPLLFVLAILYVICIIYTTSKVNVLIEKINATFSYYNIKFTQFFLFILNINLFCLSFIWPLSYWIFYVTNIMITQFMENNLQEYLEDLELEDDEEN